MKSRRRWLVDVDGGRIGVLFSARARLPEPRVFSRAPTPRVSCRRNMGRRVARSNAFGIPENRRRLARLARRRRRRRPGPKGSRCDGPGALLQRRQPASGVAPAEKTKHKRCTLRAKKARGRRLSRRPRRSSPKEQKRSRRRRRPKTGEVQG